MAQTKFGIDQIKIETPMWATWVFRIVFVLTGVATFVVASDPGIPNEIKLRVAVYLKALDMAVLGMSKLFGVQVQEDQEADKK